MKMLSLAQQQPSDQMQASFDKYATTGAYHWAEGSPFYWRDNASLIARYPSVLCRFPAGPTRFLDFGCGDRYLTYLITNRNPQAHLTGIDDEFPIVVLADVIEHAPLIPAMLGGRTCVLGGWRAHSHNANRQLGSVGISTT